MKSLILILLVAASLQAKMIERSCPVCSQCEPKRIVGQPSYIWRCTKDSGIGQMFYALSPVPSKWVPRPPDTLWHGTGLVGWPPKGDTISPIAAHYRDFVLRAKFGQAMKDAVIKESDGLADTLYDVGIPYKKRKCVNPQHRHDSEGSYISTTGACYYDDNTYKKRKCVDEIEVTSSYKKVNGVIRPYSFADTTFCNCDGDSNYWTEVHNKVRINGSFVCDVNHLPNELCERMWRVDTLYTRRPDRWCKEVKETWVKKVRKVREVWE